MSEVEVPDSLNLEQNIRLAAKTDNGRAARILMGDLVTALSEGWFRERSYNWVDQWIATQSPDTWRRLVRWLAMEVI